MKRKPLLAFALALVALSISSHAQVIPASIDFGSDPGKDGDGGFSLTAGGAGAWSTQPDSLRYARGVSSGNENAFAVKEFTSLEGNDFTITSEVTMTARSTNGTANTDRFGLLLFAEAVPPAAPSSTSGISLLLRNISRPRVPAVGDPQTDGPLIAITTGLTGSTVISEFWLGSVAAGTRYTFTAGVIYAGANFDVIFTLSDGTVTQSITSPFAAASYTNDFFGFNSRVISGPIYDYDTFAITAGAVPEPTTFAMLLGGLGLLLGSRRTRRS